MTPDLILRPSSLVKDRPWALQLRYHGSVGTEYSTIARVSDDVAQDIIKAGACEWLFDAEIRARKDET